jgi:hypothetical protein
MPLIASIIAIVLIITTKWAVKFEIPYWHAYKISVIHGVINVLISLRFQPLRYIVLGEFFSLLLLLVIQVLIGAAIYGVLIKYPNSKKSIGFGKGLLIQLYVIAIAACISVVIGMFLF